MKRAVFLDRDGTLIEDKHYLHKPEDVVLFPEVEGALQSLQDAGFTLFMVTNQSGVGRGYFSLEDVEKVHLHITSILATAGIRFEKIYIAPEAPDQPSHGRKPSPRFLLDAQEEFGIDLGASYMVGDKMADVDCGRNAGVARSLLVRTGYGAELEKKRAEDLRDVAVEDNLAGVARWILAHAKPS